MKKRNLWIVGILGLMIVLFNYLGFTGPIKSAVIIGFALVISFFAFREIALAKINGKKNPEENFEKAASQGGGLSPAGENQITVKLEEI